jgi:hypothetical protein
MYNYKNNNLKSTVSLSEYRGYCARKQLGIITKRKMLLLVVVVVVAVVVVVVVKITILCIK